MPDPHEDLQATEASILRDTEEIRSLEKTKAALDPADPRFGHLANQVERLTAGLQDKATAQRELSDEIQQTG